MWSVEEEDGGQPVGRNPARISGVDNSAGLTESNCICCKCFWAATRRALAFDFGP